MTAQDDQLDGVAQGLRQALKDLSDFFNALDLTSDASLREETQRLLDEIGRSLDELLEELGRR